MEARVASILDRHAAGGVCLAAVSALVLVLTSGCVAGIQTNRLENKSAAEVQQEAATALVNAKTVHVTAVGFNQGKLAKSDLRLQGNLSAGTMTMDGYRFDVTVDGKDLYLKADQNAGRRFGLRLRWRALLAGG
jgi:hypothetical protein